MIYCSYSTFLASQNIAISELYGLVFTLCGSVESQASISLALLIIATADN